MNFPFGADVMKLFDFSKPIATPKPILNPMSIGLVVGLPFRADDPASGFVTSVRPEWALSMIVQVYPMNVNVMYSALMGKEIGDARNDIVRHARKLKAKYLLFIDDDVAVPNVTARRLMFDLEQADEKTMVAGGIYCAKYDPTEPIVYQGNGRGAFWKWKVGDVFEVTGIGTGCMMIKMELFDHIEEPWFKTVAEYPENLRLADGTPVSSIKQTDDLYFCDKVINAGFKIIADGGVNCIHWDIKTGKPYMLPPNSYPLLPANVAPLVQVG